MGCPRAGNGSGLLQRLEPWLHSNGVNGTCMKNGVIWGGKTAVFFSATALKL